MVCSFPYLKGSRVRYCQFTIYNYKFKAAAGCLVLTLPFIEAGRGPALEFHAELQAALEQHVLDLG